MTMISAQIYQAILDTTCHIQQIPGFTFHESQRAAFVAQEFSRRGLKDVHTDEAGNVWARYPGGDARPLVITAHMDSVHPALEPPLPLVRGPERITGPGIGDNALGVAAMLGLVDYWHATRPVFPGSVWLVATVCEEGLGNLKGIRAVVECLGNDVLAYIVLEGIGLGNVFHRGLGVERFRIQVQTAGGHSWLNYGQASAIHEMAHLVTRISAIPVPKKPRTTLNVGTFHGGTAINSIASQAVIELDLRSESPTTLAALVNEVRGLVAKMSRAGLALKMENIGSRPAGEIAHDHPLVRLAEEAIRRNGIHPYFGIASTDANIPLSRGLPAICTGITTGGSSHTENEYIECQPVYRGMTHLIAMAEGAWNAMAGFTPPTLRKDRLP
ncbi:MAG: M20/M25/M40 family metallo-hydrolase [Chloroflexi bacterium]|nr:M20/M25/M40 family metallo-hydrolase [Chloroflexota bacterium]